MDYLEDLKIEPFTDEATFTAIGQILPGKLVDELSDSDPSSREYRRLMHQMGLKQRPFRAGLKRYRKGYDEYDY